MLQPFRPYDFTNNAERLLVEQAFSSWLIRESKDGYNQDLKQWYIDFYADLCPMDSDIIPNLFQAFAAGAVYGQDLARDLLRFESEDMKQWRDEKDEDAE